MTHIIVQHAISFGLGFVFGMLTILFGPFVLEAVDFDFID